MRDHSVRRRPQGRRIISLIVLLGGVVLGPLTAITPAHAGQVGVSVQIRGAGSVTVVEGSPADGADSTCDHSDNLDSRVSRDCPRFRVQAAFEAWAWLRPTASADPAGDWRFAGWWYCDETRERDGITECGVHSGAFDSQERQPVARFVDDRRPRVTDLAVTPRSSDDRTMDVTWSTRDAVSSMCSVDRAAAVPCTSPLTIRPGEGQHDIDVSSLNSSGSSSGTVGRGIVVVETALTQTPDATSDTAAASFAYSSGYGNRFTCSLDGRANVPCGTGASGATRTEGLTDGEHVMRVTAWHDDVPDPSPATFRWTVDASAPDTTLSSGPEDGTWLVAGAATYTATASRSDAAIDCAVDGNAASCPEGRLTVTGPAPGRHAVSLAARHGNRIDPNPVIRSFVVPQPSAVLTRSKGWKMRTSTAAYGGQYVTASTKGSSLSMKVAGARRLALVATSAPKQGQVTVYAGSRIIKRVSLTASQASSRVVTPLITFDTPWSGTVKIVVTSSKRPVQVEGLGVDAAS